MYFLITLFCTGLVDVSDMASSTMVLVAPSSMPSSLTLSAADIRPSASAVATSFPAFLSSSAVTILFCTGLVDVSDMASSTMVLVAPSSMPSSLTLSAADIRPSASAVAVAVLFLVAPASMPSSLALSAADIRPLMYGVATLLPAFSPSAAVTTLFCTGCVD